VIKCTRVDGIYDCDPEKYPNAKKFDTITADEAMEMNLKIMDQSAIAMAKANHLPLYVCNINKIDLIGTDKLDGTVVEM
jgi:uridylate kinase